MTAPTSSQLRADLLPHDNFRSVLAALIAVLTLGGWINALGRTPQREALAAQTHLWWIEQIVGFALAIVCVGIILRKRSFLLIAFWLTVYSLVFDLMRWIFQVIDGEMTIRVAFLLYALFLWRLWIARKQVVTTRNTVAVEMTS